MGQSVAEHSSRELVGERVPTLNPFVLVLQTVKPVLQALTLGVDTQNHSACGRGRGATRDSASQCLGLPPAHPTEWAYSSSARDQSSVGQGAMTHIRDGNGKGCSGPLCTNVIPTRSLWSPGL